jgi:hypothetical protein
METSLRGMESMQADCFTAFHFVRNDALIEHRHRERSVAISKKEL